MSTPRLEARQVYDGSVSVHIGNDEIAHARCCLTGYVSVVEISTTAGTQYMDGPTSWDGFLSELSEHQLLKMVGQRLELHLGNGQVGRASLHDHSTGYIQGHGRVPFG